jgi:hypothetical protein
MLAAAPRDPVGSEELSAVVDVGAGHATEAAQQSLDDDPATKGGMPLAVAEGEHRFAFCRINLANWLALTPRWPQ